MSETIQTASKNKPMGFFKRFFSIFAAPPELFTNIRNYPKFGAPIMYLILIAIAYIPILMQYIPIQNEETYIAIYRAYGSEFAEYAKQNYFSKPALTVLMSVIAIPIMAIFTSFMYTIVSIIICKIFRSEVSFKKLFSLFLHCLVITYIGSLFITGFCVYFNQISTDAFSFATFINKDVSPGLHQLLNKYTIFEIWQLILCGIGVFILSKLGPKKSIAVTIIVVAVFFAVTLFMPSASADVAGNYKVLYERYKMMNSF